MQSNQFKNSIISVIILNYNGNQYLNRLFSSLNIQSFTKFEIIFVDNASHDDSIEIVKQLCDNLRKGIMVKIVNNLKNYGYCKGNNIGATFANKNAKYLVFLNNDTYVDVNWLQELYINAESDSKIGVVGSKVIVMPNGSQSGAIFACDRYGQIEGINLQKRSEIKENLQDLKFFYCSGASLLIPRKIFFKIGGFDESLFMYNDDLDLCWRARLYGYNITVALSSICYHLTNSTGYGLNLPVWKYYHGIAKNRLRVLIKNYSIITLLKYLPQTIILIVLRGLLSSLVNRKVGYISAGVYGLFWNLKNLKNTLMERHKIQRLRKVRDDRIVHSMVNYSLEITYLKRLLLHSSEMIEPYI